MVRDLCVLHVLAIVYCAPSTNRKEFQRCMQNEIQIDSDENYLKWILIFAHKFPSRKCMCCTSRHGPFSFAISKSQSKLKPTPDGSFAQEKEIYLQFRLEWIKWINIPWISHYWVACDKWKFHSESILNHFTCTHSIALTPFCADDEEKINVKCITLNSVTL